MEGQHPSGEMLAAWASAEPGGRDEGALRDHLAACEACRGEAASLRAAAERYRAWSARAWGEGRAPRASPAPRSLSMGRWSLAAGLIVSAGAAWMFLTTDRGWVASSGAEVWDPASESWGALDRAPAAGTRVRASGTAVRFVLGGVVELSLAPGGIVSLQEGGVDVERGAIDVSVTPGTPFRAGTPAGSVEVTGTVFWVRARRVPLRRDGAEWGDATDVRVERGEVRVSSRGASGSPATLRPGMRALLLPGRDPFVEQIGPGGLAVEDVRRLWIRLATTGDPDVERLVLALLSGAGSSLDTVLGEARARGGDESVWADVLRAATEERR